MLGAILLPQVNATSSDGRCAPYCLTSFFELLHSTIDSYDADFIVGFFLPPDYLRLPFRGQHPNLEEKMSILLALQRLNTWQSDPVPTDPTPIPDPVPRPQPMPDPPPDEEPIKLSHR